MQSNGTSKHSLKELQLVTLEPHSSISLLCQIGAPMTQTMLQQQHLANNKISFFANGLHLHSSSTGDLFNVSLATLLANLGPNSRSLRVGCSHQLVLTPSDPLSSKTSFHANQIRQLPSSNEIELKIPGKLNVPTNWIN